MNENQLCPIWGTSTLRAGGEYFRTLVPHNQVHNSPRAGGEYVIDEAALRKLEDCDDHDNRVRARLTSWLVEQRRLGNPQPRITEKTVMDAKQSRNLTVHERVDRLLQYIERATSRVGEDVEVSYDSSNYRKMLAWSESVERKELDYLLEYLETKRWIEFGGYKWRCVLTVEGYARLAYLKGTNTESSQAFVAMWFDKSTKGVWEQGIKPGIEDAGYEPIRIDQKEHSNKIDDEIVAEIRRSCFVVADFTQGESGARGGVYYEAGFAHGLRIPVIFTCRKDILESGKVHFDTRQYNHIGWEKPEELRDKLATRISAEIGDGPYKGDNT